MEKYLFVFYGGKMPTDPKGREQSMAAWMKWFQELGTAVVEMGAPTKPGKLVNAKGVKDAGSKGVDGYSVIQADNMDAAVAFAKKCPIMAEGGEISINTVMPM